MTTDLAAPVSEIDVFADEILDDPYPTYARLRDLGPAVHLSRLDCWAVSRFADVRAALVDHERFASSGSVGHDPVLNRAREGTVIASDPPEHGVLRGVLAEHLAPRALRGLRARLEARADELVGSLVARSSFDAVTELARPFPLEVVSDLLGLPTAGRGDVLRFADAAFNTFGPRNARTEQALPVAAALFDALTASMQRDALAHDSWGAAVYAAADRGTITHAQVVPLLRAYLVASMDTTISALATAIRLLAEHPGTWRALHDDPRLVNRALEETLRLDSPVQAFFRRTTVDVDVDGVTVPAQSRVLLLYAAANRDPRKWDRPDEFVIDRAPLDHIGFGAGIHACAGMSLARVEAQAVPGALVRHATTLELAGPPRRHLNNVLRGLAALPVVVRP